MKRTIPEILAEWFYRLPDGYAIPPYNNTELQVLSKILTELLIDPKPILESLRGDMPIKEAPEDYIPDTSIDTSPAVATTNLHETFYALALAYIIKFNASSLTPMSYQEFIEIAESTGDLLKNSESTIQNAVNHIATVKHVSAKNAKKQGQKKGDTIYLKDGKTTTIFKKQWQDAFSSAYATKIAIDRLYEPTDYLQSYRVESGVELGVADDVVSIKLKDSTKDDIWVSLKYGTGQFGSLSVGKLLEKMYGFSLEVADSNYDGILNYAYSSIPGGKNAIDGALQAYVSGINTWIDETTNSEQGLPEEVMEILNNPRWERQTNNVDWDPTWNNLGRSNGAAYLYRKVYSEMNTANGGASYKQEAIAKRAKLIHPLLNSVFEELETKGRSEDLTDFISYILRADPKNEDKSYLYVAKGGKSIVSLPSQKMIKSKIATGFEIELGPMKMGKKGKELGDYARDLYLKGDGNLLCTIPIFLRFTDGQWTSDYGQKGKAPTFTTAFEEFFGAAVKGKSPSEL